MQRYRVYLLDRNFRICTAHDIRCLNDEAACHAAAQMSNDQWWELWRGRDRIRYGRGTHYVPAEPLN